VRLANFSRVDSLSIANQAKAHGGFEGILLDETGQLQTAGSNIVFLTQEDVLVVQTAKNNLNGTTMRRLRLVAEKELVRFLFR